MARPTIAILTLHPAPYRLMVFEALAADAEFRFLPFIVFSGLDQGRGAWPLPDRERFPYHAAKAWTLPLLPHSANDPAGPLFAPALWAQLAREKPDLLIYPEFGANALLALAYARLFAKPLILTTDTSEEGAGAQSRLRRAERRFLLAQTRGALVTGESGRRYLAGLGFPPEKCTPAPLVGDARLYFPATAEERAAWRAELGFTGRVFLFVGRFAAYKQAARLLAAFLALSSGEQSRAHLVFVGAGPLEGAVKARAAGSPFVSFLPLQPAAALRRLYASADFFVLPSVGEPWGLVVNEALMCGTPAIVSRGAASCELIKEGRNGLCVAPADTEALSRALRRALVLPECDYQAWREQALQTAQHYTLETVVAGIKTAVRAALER